ncbi:rab11 family-interacting protein 1 isoform X2 [Lampris incognitus]|uniref:rab11 family-interacting protein 1 isoform X2 n=1 Tax=Lampris incognitus TaxID=2546036 RepID=UPI0024B5B402|nr:rab11 family-interacting protein 1 isoform X2 [Lampris incognitus]
MSLTEQSQQWYPTSVQVTVHQARNLRVKGKNGTNDAYAIIQLAKDKFSTSVAEKCVAPVWKEEASFDLTLFHPSNAERCTLYIIVMHRAQVGLDKFLGRAVVNLLELHDAKSRKKTDWFKLVDKTGKEDKARGEVLLDIQFMRNNLSASMFDLSMQDRPRSRISKIKDKVRGKKTEGLSDSASAIVPSVSQVLTDSDGEADSQSLSQYPGIKKKSKLKSLFAPKSNLQRNISQSMSTLGTLPEKNSSLSGSRSSGLNVDSPEVKKKFKLLGHKRTGSNDSKVSQGPFSLLGRSKQSSSDLNNLCINGSHVYAEEVEPKSGSTLSLNSSGQGSVEDVHRHDSDVSAQSLKGFAVPSRQEPTDRALLDQQRHLEEEERKQAEERRSAEAKRLEEEEKHRAQVKRLQEEEERKYQEEQERRRRFLEDEAKRKKRMEEEEEERRKQEERRRLEVMEKQRLEEERQRREEAHREEEQKRQEEASMSERLSSLFGMIRKKEEKKEEVQQQSDVKEVAPIPDPHHASGDLEVHSPHQSTNPFEEIPLSPEALNPFDEKAADQQKNIRNQQTPSAMVFLNRTAKVSAVKPRPHPVKPMSSVENQYSISSPAVRDAKKHDNTAGKIKVADSVESGPYTQLTQEELITLVVKQQMEMSKKDAKIIELEEYIDNLLVRVIEEQPSILLALGSGKPA